MADLKKFEEMLERLVNEDKEGAEELFHEIVVEKSREIYESLLEDDVDIEEEADEEVEEDEDLDESADEDDDEDEEMDEGFDLDEFEVEADDDMMGGDPADDMMGAISADDDGDMDMSMDMDDEGEEDTEERLRDVEDALDELKKEFEQLMADEDSEDEEGDDDDDMDMDMGDEEGDEEETEEEFAFEAEEDDEKPMKKGKKSGAEQMREYVEKVAGGHGAETKGKGEEGGTNTKSTVAGKNDMGGTASNLNQGDEGDVVEAGKGALKGAALSDTTAKEDNAGNVNVPGSKGATKMSGTKGHGAEKKGAGETADNKKSTVGS